MTRSIYAAFAGAAFFVGSLSAEAGTGYTIVDMGLIAPSDAMQCFGVSEGGTAYGRSLGSNQGFSWTEGGGLVGLPNFASRPFASANGANDTGVVVGTGATTFFGSSPLPLIWSGGSVAVLPLPAAQSIGRANDVNASSVAVGSVDGGSLERATIYAGGTGTIITATGPGGTIMTTAFGINDAGLVVGSGIDPGNAARNVGMLYDSVAETASEVGALPGRNGALCFGVSNGGFVVGSTMMNQGSGTPFIWDATNLMTEIPLPPGAGSASARGVNSSGQVVGIGSGVFAIPFYYDGVTTVEVADFIPAGSGWSFDNTSSSAIGISDDGIIVGTGELNGDVHAYALIPDGCEEDLDGSGEVDFGDLVIVLSAWDTPGADITGDGTTGFDDLVRVLSAWGPC